MRLVGEILEGGAKPVGGDADVVVQIDDRKLAAQRAADIAVLARRGTVAPDQELPSACAAAR